MKDTESISMPYLQSHRRVWLHDMAHILHQLADSAADFLRANADDHALGRAVVLLRHLLVRRGLFLALAAPS